MARMTVVDRDGKEHEIEAKPGLKVMEILRELDYGVAAICGGLCSCATCHVYIDESWAARLPKPQSDELELLKELSDFRPATSRLSCQVEFTEALSGLKLAIAPGHLNLIFSRPVDAPPPARRRSRRGPRGSAGRWAVSARPARTASEHRSEC